MPAREPGDALSACIRQAPVFAQHTAPSRTFATEVVHGGRFLSGTVRQHMHAATAEKVKVFESWMQTGLTDPVDPVRLFIFL
jgi:hypothetical protein